MGLIFAAAVGCSTFSGPDGASTDAGTSPDAAIDGKSPVIGQGTNEFPGPPLEPASNSIAVASSVTTLAGLGAPGFSDGNGGAAQFNAPQGLAIEKNGNLIVGDTGNQRIRRITPAGDVTTVAGSGAASFVNGNGTAAAFNYPQGVTIDPSGNIYVADTGNNSIRKVSPTGSVTTLASSGAALSSPGGIAVDSLGNLIVAQSGDSRVLSLTAAGMASVLAGSGQPKFADGSGVSASFNVPTGIAIAGKTLYIADARNYRIRRMTASGTVTTLAGSGAGTFADGAGTVAGFREPTGVAADASGNVYVADSDRIRRVTTAGAVSTLAGPGDGGGRDGSGPKASFNLAYAIALDANNNLYVAEFGGHYIRKIASVGIGQLLITWKPPVSSGLSPIRGYTATATAAGQGSKSCSTAGALSCTIEGLTSGVAYDVRVSAKNESSTGESSSVTVGTPN